MQSNVDQPHGRIERQWDDDQTFSRIEGNRATIGHSSEKHLNGYRETGWLNRSLGHLVCWNHILLERDGSCTFKEYWKTCDEINATTSIDQLVHWRLVDSLGSMKSSTLWTWWFSHLHGVENSWWDKYSYIDRLFGMLVVGRSNRLLTPSVDKSNKIIDRLGAGHKD